MSLLKSRIPQAREKRLDALSAYYGDAAELSKEFAAQKVTQRIRTFTQGAPDDLIYVLTLLAGVRDAVTVIHGGRGCAALNLFLNARGQEGRWAVTALDERDTIMGADGKLRNAVLSLHRRYRPQLVFIVGTPITAINNDDIQSVVEELSEELGVTIIPFYADGFRSKNAITGYDVALHGLVRHLVAKGSPEEGGAAANLISVAEEKEDRVEIGRLLDELGIEARLLPDGATKADFAAAGTASLSLPLNPDAADFLGRLLESDFEVPYLTPPRPIGAAATGAWLRKAAAALGKEAEAVGLVARETEALQPVFSEAPLAGVRVYLSLSPADAFGVAQLVEELGGELAGVTLEHLDRLHVAQLEKLKERWPGVRVHVGQGQPFEEVNILGRSEIDLYVGSASQVASAARLGVASVAVGTFPLLGFAGVARFARQAKQALRHREFVRHLAAASKLPYRPEWYKRSANWHIKQEVK